MNTPLKTIQTAVDLRLRQHSDRILAAVKRAAVCIEHLHAHGSTVQEVEIRGDHVVIHIDRPSSAFLTGSIHISRMNRDHRETVRVSSVLCCQVQWRERLDPPLLRQEA